MIIKILDNIEIKKNNLKESFEMDVLAWLSSKNKYIPSKYFYDDQGSRLFSKITDVDEYYLTNCEEHILKKYGHEVGQLLGENKQFNLIELGVGDGRKTKILLRSFIESQLNFDYISIDISESTVRDLDKNLSFEFPELQHVGVVGEYLDAIDWIKDNKQGVNVILFLGSSIGNFNEESALVFLRSLWKHLNRHDYLFIGFDLKKDINILNQAYNDSQGVTKDFNFNILSRINYELGGTFDCHKFVHHGVYNPVSGAMESYLIAKEAHSVYIEALEKCFNFKEFESIHLEYSYKYLSEDIHHFAVNSGCKPINNFYDKKKYFADSLWQVKK
ncbi:Histidine-specific methyltransferase EgtD [Piscirickettsia salmonis]|uniref:L-histidine N(alpha)-methyltransferase n=1 Tax=Piscirickettsia salmonis TaxID=1238 RepID=UPI0012BABCE2|nr:L-histidine N(alpha)-methyltransferase [Piscirickettsia salmonis]QGP53421.1 Histidine-specific methyltransferase EgtD [Piscirickettsia salmonis]QGP60661.1 Histidine-specific methyltransferase EgtD [Piscirickettsia salmonis]QGP62987.1 Histidine-specific methyltransferase EgtD [Piscirickettsia salmonis]